MAGHWDKATFLLRWIDKTPPSIQQLALFLYLGKTRRYPDSPIVSRLCLDRRNRWLSPTRPVWEKFVSLQFRIRAISWWAVVSGEDEWLIDFIDAQLLERRLWARTIRESYIWGSTALNSVGRFDLSRQCIKLGKEALDRHFRRQQGLWNETQAFQALGHVAQQAFLIQAVDLGYVNPERVQFIRIQRGGTNRIFEEFVVAQLRQRSIEVIDVPVGRHTWQEPDHESLWPMPNGEYEPSLVANNRLEYEWQSLGRGPVLEAPASTIILGLSALEQIGVRGDAWFVGFHVRQQTGDVQSNRDSDSSNLLAAFQVVRDWGGIPILLGAPTHALRSGGTDLFVDTRELPRPTRELIHFTVWSKARAFVGNSSGGTLPPHTFGVSTLFFDLHPLTFWRPSAMHMIMPKVILCKGEENETHVLPLLDAVSRSIRCQSTDERVLAMHGYRTNNVSESDIANAVQDLLARAFGRSDSVNERDLLFDRAMAQAGFAHGARLAPSYRDSLPIEWFSQ